MECPHCQTEFAATPHVFALGEDQDGSWQVSNVRCSVCDRLITNICTKDGRSYPAWPHSSLRPRLSEDVPAEYADDYHAACQVFFHSPEATAALSRRVLHGVLGKQAGAGDDGLVDQIRRTVLGPDMPPYLKQGLQTYSRLAKLDSEPGKSLHPEALAPSAAWRSGMVGGRPAVDVRPVFRAAGALEAQAAFARGDDRSAPAAGHGADREHPPETGTGTAPQEGPAHRVSQPPRDSIAAVHIRVSEQRQPIMRTEMNAFALRGRPSLRTRIGGAQNGLLVTSEDDD